MLPSFIIGGAQKSGTTVIQRALADHPQIFIPDFEISFFEEPDYSNQTIDNLANYFQMAEPHQLCGLKRPYLSKTECASNIHKDLPRAKLIFCLRNPVERFISAYFHYMLNGFIPVKSVEEGIPKLIAGGYQTQYPASQEIIDFGFYTRGLESFYAYFPPEQILVTLYDELVEDADTFIQGIYEYLGVDKNYKTDAIRQRHRPGIYSIPRLRLNSISNRLNYNYYANHTRRIKKEYKPWYKTFAVGTISLIDQLVFWERYSKPLVSTKLKSSILNLYKADIEKLETFLGRSLHNWY